MTIPTSLKIRGLNQKHILKQVAGKWLLRPSSIIASRALRRRWDAGCAAR